MNGSHNINYFCVVCRGRDRPVVEYVVEKGDKRDFLREALPKAKALQANCTLAWEQSRVGMVYGETQEDGTAYCVVTRQDFPERVVKLLVEKYAASVKSLVEDGTLSLMANASNSAKRQHDKQCVELVSTYEGYDKVRNVQDEVNKVKGTMAANIDMQLANMASAEELDDQTVAMMQQSKSFKAVGPWAQPSPPPRRVSHCCHVPPRQAVLPMPW